MKQAKTGDTMEATETTLEQKMEVKEEQAITQKLEQKGMKVVETGELALHSLSDQLAFSQRLINEKMISDTFKTPQQVVIGMQYAISMGLKPVLALKQMYVIKGRPCLYGDAPLALCMREVKDIEEFFLDKEQKRICVENKNLNAPVWAAVTRVWRKEQALVQEDSFSLEDLARAGIDKGSNGKKDTWAKYERNMMRYKARSMALKVKFTDFLSGIGIAEYDEDFSPETPEIAGSGNSLADEMNGALDAEKNTFEVSQDDGRGQG